MLSIGTVIFISGSFIICKKKIFEFGSLSALRLKTSFTHMHTFCCSYSSWYSPVKKTMLIIYNMHSINIWTNKIVVHVLYSITLQHNRKGTQLRYHVLLIGYYTVLCTIYFHIVHNTVCITYVLCSWNDQYYNHNFMFNF